MVSAQQIALLHSLWWRKLRCCAQLPACSCSSCKRPDGVGQGSQETAMVDWLAGSGGSLLHTVIWPLLGPAQQPLQNPSSKWKHMQQRFWGEKQVWRCGDEGRFILQEGKEIGACLGGNRQQPNIGCPKAFDSSVSLIFWSQTKPLMASVQQYLGFL